MIRPPPPVLAMAAAAAQRVVTRGIVTRGAQPQTARRAAAGATAALAGLLAAASARQFRRQDTTLDPFDPTHASALVTTGVNAVSRNPMYVGMAGLLVANALRLGAWRALLPVAAFVLVIDQWQIAAEEAALSATFGADYEAYREAVPRWLGRSSAS